MEKILNPTIKLLNMSTWCFKKKTHLHNILEWIAVIINVFVMKFKIFRKFCLKFKQTFLNTLNFTQGTVLTRIVVIFFSCMYFTCKRSICITKNHYYSIHCGEWFKLKLMLCSSCWYFIAQLQNISTVSTCLMLHYFFMHVHHKHTKYMHEKIV